MLIFALLIAAPTVDDAKAFFERANKELKAAWSARERASFVNLTYITDDTDLLAQRENERAMETTARLVREAKKFQGLKLPDDLKRQLLLLRLSDSWPAADDPKAREELAKLSSELLSMYGKGSVCKDNGTCLKLDEIGEVMRTSRDFDKLRDLWVGWHKTAVPMKERYAREVELANAGAKELGFKDVGELWRSGYDMSPDAFEQETDRLWNQVKPLYDQLHCYMRGKLHDKYGDKVPATGPIPAHVLGNMWAQEWGNVYDLAEPYPGEKTPDVTAALVEKKMKPIPMVRQAESFFTSLGFAPLPETFWSRSMFERPRDREVVCHASAWDITGEGDLRIKMCIKPTEEEFTTIHHELGHNFYYQQYKHLPALYQQGANDGFHEGIGDTLALSITPEYLDRIGLVKKTPTNDKAVINQQMRVALDKIAFLPWGLLLDRWRWEVFSGRTPKDKYNARFWELRNQYQGVMPPVARADNDFDPGAKYHVPSNTAYTRYFLARILQFQFHRGLCNAAGHKGPLHTCSIYGNQAAGERLRAMLALGASKPWPEALKVAAGDTKMDASALVDYFSPLMAYLKEQNRNKKCGW